MKFLIDENLSHRLAVELRRRGHDCIHVRDRQLEGAADQRLIELARTEQRVIVTSDKDFEQEAVRSRGHEPSVIRVRYGDDPLLHDWRNVATRIDEVSRRDAPALIQGSVIHLKRDEYAVAPLPVRDPREIETAPTKTWRDELPTREQQRTQAQAPDRSTPADRTVDPAPGPQPEAERRRRR